MRRNDGNALWSAFVLEPSLQNYVNSNTCRYGHRTLAPLRQFLFQIRRSSMQHSNLPCHCLTLKKRSYHIIAAGLVSEFQTGNSSFTLQNYQALSKLIYCRAIKDSLWDDPSSLAHKKTKPISPERVLFSRGEKVKSFPGGPTSQLPQTQKGESFPGGPTW